MEVWVLFKLTTDDGNGCIHWNWCKWGLYIGFDALPFLQSDAFYLFHKVFFYSQCDGGIDLPVVKGCWLNLWPPHMWLHPCLIQGVKAMSFYGFWVTHRTWVVLHLLDTSFCKWCLPDLPLLWWFLICFWVCFFLFFFPNIVLFVLHNHDHPLLYCKYDPGPIHSKYL